MTLLAPFDSAGANGRPMASPVSAIMRALSRLSKLNSPMSTHDKIVAILGTEILKGAYRPGENMPAEVDLIRRFHVSRTVMREVTKTLAAKGFVVSKTRIGTKVRDPLNWNFLTRTCSRGECEAEWMRSSCKV